MEKVLSGTWFITRSSLDMWRHWDNPSVTYSPLPGGQILDTVRATRNRQTRLIVGLDTPQPEPGDYLWRGLAPLTKLVTSRWKVLAHDPAGAQWAVTLFERTSFTPAGLDIYTRAPYLLPDTEAPLLRQLQDIPEAAMHLPQLFAPRHDAGPR